MEHDYPKAPVSAFCHFVLAKKSENKRKSLQDNAAKLNVDLLEMWESWGSDKKKPWVDQAVQDKQRYQRELQKLGD